MFYTEWFVFFAAVLMMGLVIVVPGYIVARGALWSKAISLCVAPCLSIAFYLLAGIALSLCGGSVSVMTLIAFSLLLAFLLRLLFSIKRGKTSKTSKCATRIKRELDGNGGLSFAVVCLYVATGFTVAFIYFIMRLDGPNSFANASDTCAHLNYVRAFMESGTYNVLKVSSDASSIAVGGFYPAAWHVLTAIATFFTKSSVPMAANVVNLLVLALLFPSACVLFLSKIFAEKTTELRVGSVVCVCFVGFPWIFLVWGQLVSNMLGFALVPTFVFLFDELISAQSACKKQQIVCLLLASMALLFAQPNAIFTAGIFCIPSIIKRIHFLSDRRNCGITWERMLLAVVFVGIALIWLAFYKAPFMRGVVSFDWRPASSLAQSIANAVCLAYGSLQTAQPLLGFLVLLGFIRLAADEDGRKSCAVYLFCLLIYVANNMIGFPHSHVLSGFWYNDPYRTGAMLALASTPLACSGMSVLLSVSLNLSRVSSGQLGEKCVCAAVAAVLGCALLFPSYELPGYGVRRTGFGSYSELVETLYSHDNAGGIDSEEWQFLGKVREVVGNDLVLNIPEDGSGTLYGVSGINILFRRFPTDPQEPTVAVLGKRLSELSTDSEVRCKVRAMGLRYVLMLDCHGDKGEGSLVAYASQPDLWSGVYSIEHDTPGFELLLSEGDMRLYRIDDEYLG